MLHNRWIILALLFLVRAGMGVQFQLVPSLAPLFIESFALTVAEIGLLIGIYQAPGIFLALPGGTVARRFGDKRVVLAGLALMTVGGLVMVAARNGEILLAGRLIGGAGGILMNVVMTKMVTDWFAGREMNTAMAIYVNSWPCGIALALVVLPGLAEYAGLVAGVLAVVVYCAVALAGMALLYAPPPAVPTSGAAATGWPDARVIVALLLAGSVWGLYNAGLAVVFSFGSLMLAERGYSMVAAGAVTSIVLWVAALSVVLGGVIADKSGRPGGVIALSLAGFALAMLLASRSDAVTVIFAVMGLVGGLGAGPVMSLAAQVLTPATRAVGMGIFFTFYYAIMMCAPWLAGTLAEIFGSARVAFDAGAAALLLAFPFWGVFHMMQKALRARQVV